MLVGRGNTYASLRLSQTVPFLRDPRGGILHVHVFEVAAILAFSTVDHVGRHWSLDQPLIFDGFVLLLDHTREHAASAVGVSNLDRGVRIDPSVVRSLIGSAILIGLVLITLK